MNFKSEFANLIAKVVLAGVTFLCLVLSLVYLVVTRPMADDFGRATCQTFSEAITRTSQDYMHWTGRWVSDSLQFTGWSMVPQLTSHISVYYSIFLGLVWMVAFAGCLFIVKLIVGELSARTTLMTLGITLVYYSFYDNLAETWYWLPGATEGGLAVIFMAMALWIVMAVLVGQIKVRKLTIFILILSLILAPGCHELAGVTASAYFAFLSLWFYFHDKKSVPKFLLWVLVVSIAGTAISVFAPGNALRSAQEIQSAPSLLQMINTFSLIVVRVLRVVFSPQMLLSLPLLALWIRRSPNIKKHMLLYSRYVYVITGAISFALAGVAILYSYKVAGHPAGRTINFFCSSMILVAAPAWVMMIMIHMDSLKLKKYVSIESAIMVMLGLAMIAGPNFNKGFFSYKSNLLPWVKDQEARHSLLLKHAGEKETDIMIKAGPPPPHLIITTYELNEDPENWGNSIQANYYGVKSIRLEGSDASE